MLKMVRKFRMVTVATTLMVAITASVSALDLKWREVQVTDGDEVKLYKTSARTIQEFLEKDFLEQEGIEVTKYDELSVSPEEAVQSGIVNELEIQRNILVRVRVDSKMTEMIVPEGYSVADVIAEIGNESDKVTYLYDGNRRIKLECSEEIKLKTRKEKQYSTLDKIPYEVKYVETEELDMGVERVKTAGAEGTVEIVTNVVFIGDKKDSEEIVSENIVKEAVSEVIEKGTGRTIETDIGTLRIAKEILMEATAYTAGYECTGKRPGDPYYGITATGMKVRPGVVAIDPRVIPYGTKLYVEGYGEAIAADTGSAIKGNKIDLYHEELSEAYKFGRRNLKVYVLK